MSRYPPKHRGHRASEGPGTSLLTSSQAQNFVGYEIADLPDRGCHTFCLGDQLSHRQKKNLINSNQFLDPISLAFAEHSTCCFRLRLLDQRPERPCQAADGEPPACLVGKRQAARKPLAFEGTIGLKKTHLLVSFFYLVSTMGASKSKMFMQ